MPGHWSAESICPVLKYWNKFCRWVDRFSVLPSSLAPAKGFGLPLRYAKDPCRYANATLSPKATLCRYAMPLRFWRPNAHVAFRYETCKIPASFLPYSCLICFFRRHFVQVFVNMAEQTASPNLIRNAIFIGLHSCWFHLTYILGNTGHRGKWDIFPSKITGLKRHFRTNNLHHEPDSRASQRYFFTEPAQTACVCYTFLLNH